METSGAPRNSYGILRRERVDTELDVLAEEIAALGYAVLEAGYSKAELDMISCEFDRTRRCYVETFGESWLKDADEHNTIRAILTHGGEVFLGLALNRKILALMRKLIRGAFILNQQNGIINPPEESYNQAAWHRDLPYQHFVSSIPLAINALFCVDDFTRQNGATFVLPASHRSEAFPSEHYVGNHAVQVEAKAGSYIVLDCMVFHAGGFNASGTARRAVNHVYTIPYFKQQISLCENMVPNLKLSDEARQILGFTYAEPKSIDDYLSKRRLKR